MTLAERAKRLGLHDASLYQIFDRVEQLETQLAEEAEAHAMAMNAAYVEMEAIKDKWYRRGIAGFQEAVAAEREACAKVCEGISDEYQRRESMKYAELKTDAQTGASDCDYAIRARN